MESVIKHTQIYVTMKGKTSVKITQELKNNELSNAAKIYSWERVGILKCKELQGHCLSWEVSVVISFCLSYHLSIATHPTEHMGGGISTGSDKG
jgi:hypothetical protein